MVKKYTTVASSSLLADKLQQLLPTKMDSLVELANQTMICHVKHLEQLITLLSSAWPLTLDQDVYSLGVLGMNVS